MTWKFPCTFKVILGLGPQTVFGHFRYAGGLGSGQDSTGRREGNSWCGLPCVGVQRGLSE